MKDEKKALKSSSGRGTYARQACNHCRRRKSKCDGQQPVCGPCRDSGRADECTWGHETAKKARTQQHFESLVNHIKSLEVRVKELECELSQTKTRRSLSLSDVAASGSGGSSSLSPRPSPIAKFEPDDGDGMPHMDLADDDGDDDGDSPSRGSDQDSEIEQLIAPTRHLVLQGGDLELYGPTSAYRLAPERTPLASNSVPITQPSSGPEPVNTSPNFDWSRYLPPEAPLSRTAHDRLLDLLFRFCTSWCFRIIPSLFLRDMHHALSLPASQPHPKSSHYSPMLHNAALALATAFSDDPVVHNIEFRRHFARRAKSYIEKDCLSPSVCLVTALGLVATFHSSRGEQSLGYLYAGMAGRMTQALGLQIECSSLVKAGRIKESDMLDRNWAYWTTFCQDICWSLYIGRDCALTPLKEGRTVPVPFVDSEFDREPWTWEPSGLPSQKSNIASVFAATCKLLRIARRVMDFVNGLGTDFKHPNLQVVSELDIELNAWKDSLTAEVDLTAATRPSALPHRLSVHLMFWWLFILLHRPFYRRTKATNIDIDHIKLCNRAAENMIQLLRIWHNNYNLRYVSTTHVQFVFSAGTVFVLSAIQAISGPRLGRVTLATSLSQTEKCIEFLSIIGGSWETAVCAKEILLNFFDETLKPRLLLRGGEASLMQFDMPSTAASQVAGAERMGDPRARTSSSATAASVTSVSKEERQDESPSFSLSTSAIPVPLSPTLPTPCSPINDLRYFPSNPPAPNLGWPMMHSVESSPVGSIGNVGAGVGVSPKSSLQYHMTLPSPTIDRYISHSSSHSHSNSQGGGDMDLDVGYVLGMDMNIISDIPAVNHGRATNRQVHAHSQGTAADMMSFGVPELGVGYQFDPHTHSHIALDFSEEELAIMDQIVRQQQHQHQHQHHHPHQHQQHGGTGLDMMYPTGVSLA